MSSRPRFVNPPVREVNLTIYFDPIQTLQTLTIARLRVDWSGAYPKLSEVLPRRPWKDQYDTFIEMLTGDAGWPMPFCEFISTSGDRAIHLQNDRFGISWRFDADEKGHSDYPGHEALTEELLHKFANFEKLVTETLLLPVKAERVTVGYVNHIEGITPQRLAVGVLTGWSGTVPEDIDAASRCALRIGYLPPDDSDINVALTIRVEPGAVDEIQDDAATLSLDALRPVESTKEIPVGLQDAHDAIVSGFLRLTTDEMKRQWGGKP